LRISIDSLAVGRSLPVSVVVPEGAPERRRALVVFLHGRGADEKSSLNDAMYEALAAEGPDAPVMAFPYGGDHGYWHDRSGARWGRYVMREVIPRVVHEAKVDPRRIAIGGISMGGFGALDLARLHPRRFCGVGAHSPALWQTGGETAPGAFDDAEDFARHDVVGKGRGLRTQRVWVDAGRSDPFLPGVRAFTAATGVRPHMWPGGHDGAYWNDHWDEYVAFYARALKSCGR
jgi:S-formylglutathione hydrolase FrmB